MFQLAKNSLYTYFKIDGFYKPKEAFEECDIYEWSKRREIQEGGYVNTAVKDKKKRGVKESKWKF